MQPRGSQPDKKICQSLYPERHRFYPYNRSASDYQGELVIIDDLGDRIAADIISGETLTIETHDNGHAIHGTIREEGIAGVFISAAEAGTPRGNCWLLVTGNDWTLSMGRRAS